MKRILIVNKGFAIGGIETALVNMANALQKHYQVDLLVFDPTGPVKDRLDEKVNIIQPSWRFNALGMPLKRAIKTKKPFFTAFRLFATIWTKLFDNRLPIDLAIKHQEKLQGYDLAISFHQEMRRHTVASGFSRFVDQCVVAKRKVAWLHYDSAALDLDSAFNNPFYAKMDKIVCVSRSLRDGFAGKFPQFAKKTEYCYNFLNFQQLEEESLKKQEHTYPADKTICFSACRLAKEKALARAITCLAPIFRKHPEYMWFIAGEGPERPNIERAIQTENLQQQVILLGNLSNPYPYMSNADLLINVSYHEAAPMVFIEAKALGVPVFATRTSSAEELLSDPECGFICDNTEKGIYDAFQYLTENPKELRCRKEKLRNFQASNKQSLMVIQSWLEN
ncbi:MAG: glycosyltransferase [Oscillospiraceae bacterium]|nr:glycosyltransferase [Oscillospiraceae bacterium]